MTIVTSALAELISANLSSADESISGCQVEIDLNVGSGERIESAAFALALDLSGTKSDGIGHLVFSNSEGDIGGGGYCWMRYPNSGRQ